MAMIDPSRIEEHMPVIGSDGQPVGTVDRVEGNCIKLTRAGDQTGGGQYHVLPLDAVASCDGGQVRLSMPAEQARRLATRGMAGAERAPDLGR
jgi:hypothetical protein